MSRPGRERQSKAGLPREADADGEASALPTTGEPAPAPKAGRWRRRLSWTVAWLVMTGLVVLALRTMSWARVWTELRHVRVPWLMLALLANTLIIVCWTALWRTFVPDDRRVRFSTMFGINAITAALMNTTPLLVGHASGMAMLVKRAGLEPSGALGVLALDQLAEGVAKVLTFLLAALLLPLPTWMRNGVIGVAAAVGALLVVLLVLAHLHRPERDDTPAQVTAWQGPPGWRRRAWMFMQRWARQLDTLRDWRKAGMALLFAVAMKSCEALGIFAVQRSLGVHLPLETLPVVLATVMLATMIPLSPGNLGPYEAATLFAYRYLGVPAEQALSLGLIQHLAFLAPMLGVGYSMMSLGAGRSRAVVRRRGAEGRIGSRRPRADVG